MSAYFASSLDMMCEPIAVPIRISTPVGDSLVVDRVYRSRVVSILGCESWVDLIMVDFDVILGMD